MGAELKVFTYGTAQNNPALGKLKKARRNNYAISPITQSETNFWIEEEYFYDAMDGRVSRRESVCHPYKIDQTFTYDPLGGIKDLGYPECEVACVPEGNQERTVTYTYTEGRVTGIVDSNAAIGDWIPPGVVSEQNWNSGPYAYDGSGNITTMGADVFAYDKVSRIVESTVSGQDQDYTYDAYGNFESITTTEPPNPPVHGVADFDFTLRDLSALRLLSQASSYTLGDGEVHYDSGQHDCPNTVHPR